MDSQRGSAMDRINKRVEEATRAANANPSPEAARSKQDLKQGFLEIAKQRVKAKKQAGAAPGEHHLHHPRHPL